MLDKLKLAFKNDMPYEKLITSIRSGFPESKMKTEPDLRPFWEVQNRLSCSNDLVWLDNRIVIPKSYRSQILNLLHSAHQGVTGMTKVLTKQYIGQVLPTVSETHDTTARDVTILLLINRKNH